LNEFFDKFVEAWNNRKSSCNGLKIECRRKTRDSAIFLITADYKVIGQFPIPEYLLKETEPLRDFGYVVARGKSRLMKDRESSRPACLRIKDLKAGMKRVDLKARVTEISEPRLTFTRFHEYAMFAKAVLLDETSTIRLTLWNERIKSVSVNDVIQIKNADVIVFRGERQLRMGKNGEFEVLDKDSPSTQGLQECSGSLTNSAV
jgi:replication factor A1